MAWDQSDPNCWVRAATATGNIYSEEDAAKKTPRSQLYKMITCSGCNQHTGETVWASYDAIVNRVYHDTCSPDEDFFCFMCEANPKKEIDKKTKSTTCPSCAHTAPYEEAKAGQPCALTAGCNGILNTMPDMVSISKADARVIQGLPLQNINSVGRSIDMSKRGPGPAGIECKWSGTQVWLEF